MKVGKGVENNRGMGVGSVLHEAFKGDLSELQTFEQCLLWLSVERGFQAEEVKSAKIIEAGGTCLPFCFFSKDLSYIYCLLSLS